MAANSEERQFPCENCSEILESRIERNKHLREVHGVTPEEVAEGDGKDQEIGESTADNPEQLDSVDYQGHAPEDVEDGAKEDEVNLKGGDYKTANSDKTEEKSISERWEETGDENPSEE